MPVSGSANGVAAEVDVENEALVGEVLVDVAVGALEVDSRSAPSSSIRVGRGEVRRLGTSGPVVQLDVVAGPLDGICVELGFRCPRFKGESYTYRYRRWRKPKGRGRHWQCIPG